MYVPATCWRRKGLQKGHLSMPCTAHKLSSNVPIWTCNSKLWRSLTNGKFFYYYYSFFFIAQSEFCDGNIIMPIGKKAHWNTSKLAENIVLDWYTVRNVREESEEEQCDGYWLKPSWFFTEPEKECGKAGSSSCSSTKYLHCPGQIPSLLCLEVTHLQVE